MSDGHSLRQSWHAALNDAEAHFRRLIASSQSSEWKRITHANRTPSNVKGKARAPSLPDLSDVVIHRKASGSGDDIYRILLDIPAGDDPVPLDDWKAVLSTPELRQEWDPAVEESHLVEMFDQSSRIVKTNFALGWPANPRDAITISRSFYDASTIIDISTSLPRSVDEPAYLRPSPPHVRSHLTLLAWCVQYIPPPLPSQAEEQPKKKSPGNKFRILCFSQHDLKAIWNIASSSGIAQQLSTMTLGLLKTVMSRGSRVPVLSGYGNGVTIERVCFQVDREALTIDYAIIPEDVAHSPNPTDQTLGVDDLQVVREHRRLTRSVECVLPSLGGWDVQLSIKASSREMEQLPWNAKAIRRLPQMLSALPAPSEADQILLRVVHSSLLDDHSILKVRLVIEVSGPSSGLRLNGIPQPVEDIEDRDPSSYFTPQHILQDVSSTADMSFHTSSSSINTTSSAASSASSVRTLVRPAERSGQAERTVLSRVRRNYIYFSSLLQEPEAKWKRTTEARGVSVTQLDSIDPTLVVYRAEATFVGVALWDLYGALVSPGARVYWDKQHEDAILLEDVNELTELWHFKTKPAWPVNGRDSVVLKTVYKSPAAIHVFSFSADDPHLFFNIPPVEPNVIRTQVDLQGWAIEALSPTTTLLTLLEQSDPKGWTNKTSIPQQMINNLAGIGEFAIKCGGPPVVTRLAGAKANVIRYDHERGSFRIEYEGSASRRSSTPEESVNGFGSPTTPVIECEIRCDVDTWASSLDIVVDPPPQSISCLRRHRLSAEGGGLWLTLSHDAHLVEDEHLQTMVRRGPNVPNRERGVVMVNGAKVQVDVEEIAEQELKSLTRRKRIKPLRIPLDQPPVMSAIRRKRAELDVDCLGSKNGNDSGPSVADAITSWAYAPKLSSPLARFFTTAIEQAASTTQQAVAAIAPAAAAGEYAIPSSAKLPMQYALEALAWVQATHSRHSYVDWTLVSDNGLSIHRRLSPEMSPVIPVHKGEKVIEGVSAEELASVVTEYNCRKKWDDRFDSAAVLEAFGAESRTSFLVSRGGFPFRDRGFYLASVCARAQTHSALHRNTGDSEHSNGTRSAIFCVAASFSPESVSSFSATKYNQYGLPIGRVFVDGWILETLDPYTTDKYAIPSTRCTRLVAVDYAGSIPAAVNSMINTAMARSILSLETYIKSISPLPITRLPAVDLLLSDKKMDEEYRSSSWKLRRRDEDRLLIMTNFSPDAKVYRVMFLVTSPPTRTSSPGPSRSEQSTPAPSRFRSPGGQSDEQDTFTTPTLSPSANFVPSSSGGSPTPNDRLRSPSSAFTLRGEVRPSTDLLLAEIIIDSKLYVDGYAVQLRSQMRSGTKVISLHSPVESERVLPIAYTIHTMPPSPLHSSGLNADRLTRHLLRLTLPTAQYQISTVQDPLTGELRSAPPKPQWLLDFQEKGAIVDVTILPAARNGKYLGNAVNVDGTDVTVMNEKDSLTSLGRDELQDDRLSKMAILSRIAGDSNSFPDELKVPLAIAENLVEPSAVKASEAAAENLQALEERQSTVSEKGEDDPSKEPQTPPVRPDAPPRTPSLLGFLQSNPLTRFSSTSLRHTGSSSTQRTHEVDGGAVSSRNALSVPQYPLSTVIIIALIAFLIGSLLRSLISPADFIYVVTDLQDAEEASRPGWREIKRLLEVKYIVGGWDFQIAVVRRH